MSRRTRRSEVAASVVLSVCAGVQYFDLTITNRYDVMTSYFFDSSGPYFVDRLSDPRWQLLQTDSYRHMEVIPTSLYGCHGLNPAEGYYSGRVALLSLEAYR